MKRKLVLVLLLVFSTSVVFGQMRRSNQASQSRTIPEWLYYIMYQRIVGQQRNGASPRQQQPTAPRQPRSRWLGEPRVQNFPYINSFEALNNYNLLLAQATGINRDKLLAQKSSYQDKYWKTYNNIGDLVLKALPSTNLIYNGDDNTFRSEVNNVNQNFTACMTNALLGKISTSTLDDELEVFGYLLWFVDESLSAVERIGKSDIADAKKTEGIIGIVRGCQRLASSVFSSVKEYKDKILDVMNKDVLASAPSKPTKFHIDSVYITVFADSTKVGFTNPGKSNYCNGFKAVKTTGKTWENPENAGAADGVYTSATVAAGENSDELEINKCNINLSGSTKEVTGIRIDVRRYMETSIRDVGKDLKIQLVKNGQDVGINNASSTIWNDKATSTIYSYGGENDAWGTKWTAADIRDLTLRISVKNDGPAKATAAATPTPVATTAPKTETKSTAPAKEHPLVKLIRLIKENGTIKSGTTGAHVHALQEALVMLKMGDPGTKLADALKAGTTGKAAKLTLEAFRLVNQFLEYWAGKNDMAKDEDFVKVIENNKKKIDEFGLSNANALLKYIQKSQVKK